MQIKQVCLHCSRLLSIFALKFRILRKKKTISRIDPDFLKKEKASLIRKNRQVIYLNDKEMAAISEYCSRFKVNTKSVLFRQAIMEKILKGLDSNPPTLF